MNSKMNVQELKSERVQEELLAEEVPLVIWLKSERVQEPGIAPFVAEASSSSIFEMSVNLHQRVTIDLHALQVSITLEGPMIGSAQAADLGQAE